MFAEAGQLLGKENGVHPPSVGATVDDTDGDGPGQPHKSAGIVTVLFAFPMPLSIPERTVFTEIPSEHKNGPTEWSPEYEQQLRYATVDPPSVVYWKPTMRAVALGQVILSGESRPPPAPPTLYELVLLRQSTTASNVLPPRALTASHGGRGPAAGQPGGQGNVEQAVTVLRARKKTAIEAAAVMPRVVSQCAHVAVANVSVNLSIP